MSEQSQIPTLEEVVALCKRRGFVFPTSEIYGGLTSSYDYGPLGSQLLKNIKDLWWNEFITLRSDMVGLDSQIMLHPETWVASGHVGSFSDPLVEDVVTNKRYRADHLIEQWIEGRLNQIENYIVTLLMKIKKDTDAKSENVIELINHYFYEKFDVINFSGAFRISNDSKTEDLLEVIRTVINAINRESSDNPLKNEVFLETLRIAKQRMIREQSSFSKINISSDETTAIHELVNYYLLKYFVVEDLNTKEMGEFIENNDVTSPDGNKLSEPKEFNLLFETSIGAVSGDKAKVYLRGETAQGIFTNFKNVLNSTRVQLPFGIGQVGKSFRNELTTGQFVFRTLEFEQGEIEYFFDPEQTNWEELFSDWQDKMKHFIVDTLGIRAENVRWRTHTDKERSFYSKQTVDLDYQYPFGWKELWGLAYRTDYDLNQHIKHSGEKLDYTDPHTGKKITPHVIEPAVGIGRLFLMVLVDAYWYDQENKRTVLKLHPRVAPYKAAIFPLLKNKPELVKKAQQVFDQLATKYPVIWDERGNIGKRYLYQDEIGTPACITIDFDSLEDDTVTIRNRDTTVQERIKIVDLEAYLDTMLD